MELENISRIINSLLLIGQNSAEREDFTLEVYADLFEAIRLLNTLKEEAQAA